MKTGETKEQRDRRMAWWREAKFGMFIHWGLYSALGGEWKGRKAPFYSEWIMCVRNIPDREYSKTAKTFNPVEFDAREWARLAKGAGMKYIVITAKHHDGFSMYGTRLSGYNIVDATPFGRDPLAELADACRAEGLRFGVYYSQLDWHWAVAPWHFPVIPKFGEYVEFMKGQLEELLTGYGPICSLFFDGDWMPQWFVDPKLQREVEDFCRELQPDVIINNRIGARPVFCMIPALESLSMDTTAGDYETPEQFILKKSPKRDWETNMTMNDTFGYNKFDNNWKSTRKLTKHLEDAVSLGGNFLLNVGPDGLGSIPPKSAARLREIGDWTRANKDRIWGV